jgi:hypothetical protein
MFGIDRFVVHVCKMATESRDLLHEPVLSLGHQFAVALIPQLVTMCERPWDATAVGLDSVFPYKIRLEGWQFPMPEHAFHFVGVHAGLTLAFWSRTAPLRRVQDDPIR